jgi:hypothetical protein
VGAGVPASLCVGPVARIVSREIGARHPFWELTWVVPPDRLRSQDGQKKKSGDFSNPGNSAFFAWSAARQSRRKVMAKSVVVFSQPG